MEKEISLCAKLTDFNKLQSYTNLLPTKEGLSFQVNDLRTQHNLLEAEVKKNYATKSRVDILNEEQLNRLQNDFLTKHDFETKQTSMKSRMTNIVENNEALNVKVAEFEKF